ncbi:MAG: Gfo/Idh/MocA family oxidoreductase [Bacillota bacterium]|nr:Gfo/Idh/MocA family oxidoreductase [Bacillota bacterium]
MRKVKIGIIGCGVISNTYISNIKAMFSYLEIVACADINIDRAREMAKKYSIPKAYSTEELLADPEIEIAVNLTIPSVHAEVNQKALLAGKHVYCEKPFALSLEDAEATMELARSKGLRIGVAPETFLGAGIQTCRKAIDEGWIGKPIAATANMVSSGTETWHSSPEFFYKKGAGPLLDMGPYYITALVTLLGPIGQTSCFSSIGNPQRRIYSNPLRGKMIDVEVPTTYTGIMKFESGVHVNMNMSFDVWFSNLPKLEIYGTEGTLIVPDPNMFGGQIKIFRKERVLDSISGSMYGEKKSQDTNPYEHLQEIPQVYQQPLEYMRGLGVLDMAYALVNGRKHRANEELAYHVTEAMLSFDIAEKEGIVYKMKSTCSRPDPLPKGMEFGELD